MAYNANQQGPSELQNEHAGKVWQPYAMGGGQWVVPQAVRLSDDDVERIAQAVLRLIEKHLR